MTQKPVSEWNQPQRFYEVLGRTMAALQASGALDGADGLRWWSADHMWKIEWRCGPFPYEVAAQLWKVAAAADSVVALAVGGMVRLEPPTGSSQYAFVQVMDVPVMLRALEPVGAAEVARRQVESLREPVAALT